MATAPGTGMVRRRVSAVVLVVAVALLSAGCGGESAGRSAGAADEAPSTTVPPAPPTAPPATVPPCPPSGALVTVDVADAAMGLRVMAIVLTNCGPQSYTVEGYPTLTLLDEERRPFDVEVFHGAEPVTGNEGYCTPTGLFDAGPQPVTLAPGERARSGVVWRNTTTDQLDRLVNATHLSVVPAATESPQVVTPDAVIDLGTTGRLGVSAWRPDGTSC